MICADRPAYVGAAAKNCAPNPERWARVPYPRGPIARLWLGSSGGCGADRSVYAGRAVDRFSGSLGFKVVLVARFSGRLVFRAAPALLVALIVPSMQLVASPRAAKRRGNDAIASEAVGVTQGLRPGAVTGVAGGKCLIVRV